MSSITNNHPFRESVTKASASEPTNASAGEQAGGSAPALGASTSLASGSASGSPERDGLVSGFLRGLKPKTRVKLIAGIGLCFCVLYSMVLGSDEEPATATYASRGAMSDYASGGRDVAVAKREAGIFASIFCKGTQRAAFCD